MTKRIVFKKGTFCYPETWIKLDVDNPPESDYPVVVELRNGDRFNAPHMLLFSKKHPMEMTNEEINHIKQLCALKSANAAEALKHEVLITANGFVDIHGNTVSRQDWFDYGVTFHMYTLPFLCGDPFGCRVESIDSEVCKNG